jgi:hypothetical protein
MAFCGEYYLQQLEDSIGVLRLALSEPEFINMRVISTNIEGISEIEVLQRDLPFTSPLFTKTSVFDHPDIKTVEFRTWPLPHFWIIGTVQGVKSAMLRRYAYFIQWEAVSFFKQVSADSLISRQGSHLLPALWKMAKLQAALPQRRRDIPPLEPIPTAMRSAASSSLGSCRGPSVKSNYDLEEWDPEPPKTQTVDPIPKVSFRRYDPTIDLHIYRPPTPTPLDTLSFIEEDSDTPEDDQPAISTDPATLNPPPTPPVDIPTPSLPHPVHPPSPPLQTGNPLFSKIRLKFPSIFK